MNAFRGSFLILALLVITCGGCGLLDVPPPELSYFEGEIRHGESSAFLEGVARFELIEDDTRTVVEVLAGNALDPFDQRAFAFRVIVPGELQAGQYSIGTEANGVESEFTFIDPAQGFQVIRYEGESGGMEILERDGNYVRGTVLINYRHAPEGSGVPADSLMINLSGLYIAYEGNQFK